jgi:predicted ATPase
MKNEYLYGFSVTQPCCHQSTATKTTVVNNQTKSTPTQRYDQFIKNNVLTEDYNQRQIIQKLEILSNELQHYEPPSQDSSIFSRVKFHLFNSYFSRHVLKSTSTIDFISSLRAIPECMQFSH